MPVQESLDALISLITRQPYFAPALILPPVVVVAWVGHRVTRRRRGPDAPGTRRWHRVLRAGLMACLVLVCLQAAVVVVLAARGGLR